VLKSSYSLTTDSELPRMSALDVTAHCGSQQTGLNLEGKPAYEFHLFR
jgi:hypothetical protein